MHGLDRGEILVYHAVETAPAVTHVADDAAEDTHVGIGVDVNFNVHLLAKLKALEDEYPLDDYHARGADGDGPVRAVVNGIIVHGALHRVTRAQLTQRVDEHFRVKCVRVVVVEPGALLIGHVVVRLVVIIMVDDRNIARKALHQLPCDGGLAAAGPPGDTDDHNIAHSSCASPNS